MHNILIKETMEDNECIFTPIQQTVVLHFLQVLEEISCALKIFLVLNTVENNIFFSYEI